MFYKKHKSSNLVTVVYYAINTMYIYSWKKIDKIVTNFGDALCKTKLFSIFIFKFSIFFIARNVQLENIVHPPGIRDNVLYRMNKEVQYGYWWRDKCTLEALQDFSFQEEFYFIHVYLIP